MFILFHHASNLKPFARKLNVIPTIDVSRSAQLRDIETSFAACNENFNMATLSHPTKPNVTAVESFEVLPDADIWANQYDLFRFSERPGERPFDVCLLFHNFWIGAHNPSRSMIHALTAPFSDL